MIDHFALLDEPRRPWLDPELLKRKFLALSADSHPDLTHHRGATEQHAANARFAELNSAYSCLRDPKERLRHLIELESGARPAEIQQIPPDLMELFMQVSQLCRQTDVFLIEKLNTTSPLLQVQLFKRGQEWADQLTSLQSQIDARHETLRAELKELDATWIKSDDAGAPERREMLPRLEELYRLFSYFARWSQQIRERLARISL